MQGNEIAGRRSNFVHTTIGILTNEFSSYNDVSQILHTIKHTHDLADLPSKSNYLMERPKISAQNSVFEKVYNDRVVVLEKDDALKLLLKTFLEIQGLKYEEIQDLQQLNNMEIPPAIIIIDLSEDDSAYSLENCKRIRENAFFNNSKIIATSVLHDKELILSTGADLYLPKPYELPNLLTWINFFIKEFNQ